ncbi:MAG: amidase, partial [Cytophagaceae bacterium]|nr:amidase [Gemmatimonadaceae bacterium]
MPSDVMIGRRQLLEYFGSMGLSSTLLPGVLWAQAQQQPQQGKLTREMLRGAAAVAGLEFNDAQLDEMIDGLTQNVERYKELRNIPLDNGVPLTLHYSPLAPGMTVDKTPRPMRTAKVPRVSRPARLEDLAYTPLTHLSELVRTRRVRSVELTEMYLARLKRLNPTLNCVVTFTDELAMQQARQADTEIAAGRYRGPLHGIPWGAKDIIAVKGYPTTWGSGAFKDQRIDADAGVVDVLREAGAVLIAKLTTGELAGGDQWFGGRTNSPWDPNEGSSGSSAGPASATAGGGVAFGIGTETSGSILSPSSICGATGLRPTYGRVTRAGVMTLSWSQDRVGPICRTVEDCAVVLRAIARPDGRVFSVIDYPFNWDASRDLRALRIGYLENAFREDGRNPELKANDEAALAQLRALGLTLVPFSLPDLPMMRVTSAILGVESATAFDEFARNGGDARMTAPNRGSGFRRGHFVPAIEYLQAQRIRGLIMQQLAEVTAPFDVWVAPY